MDRLAVKLKSYLAEVTGQKVTVDQRDSSNLTYYLSQRYAFFNLRVGTVSFVAVLLRNEEEFKPAQFMKHLAQIPGIDLSRICVVAETLPSYIRKRMIEKGITFVLPMVQMYLPMLGMELRPRSGRKKPNFVERFSPATQVVLINWLLGRINESVTPLVLSKQLGYSTMTMSRALDELEASKIAQVERVGRERLVSFSENRKAIWQDAHPRLRNPISHTVRIFKRELSHQNILLAGVSALSTQSMLSEPPYPEYAISRDGWKAMERKGIEKIPVEDSDTCLLQVWCYDPKILKVAECVDPFSLYLSLQDETDERIEMALEKMMEQYL